jgi:hypothetical protein
VAADDTGYHIAQAAPNDDWTNSLSGPLQDGRLRDTVAQNQDGRLEVFGVAADDTVYHIAQREVDECIVVHFKSLLRITQTIQASSTRSSSRSLSCSRATRLGSIWARPRT